MVQPIDISVSISPRLPLWPDSPAVGFDRRLDLARGDDATDTTLRFSAHTGTHVDAPAHFVKDGPTVDTLALSTLIGPVWVVDVQEVDAIDAAVLQRLNIPTDTRRLLFKTSNSRWWAQNIGDFQTDFVALTADAAQWVVDHGIQLVGIDYLSIQRFYDGPQTHLTLLRAGVVILETLNLTDVEAGPYELCCLPLKLTGVEAAPARAVLLPIK